MTVANSGASLTGATTAAAGTAITFTSVCKRHGMAIVVEGYAGTGAAQLRLELSLDDVNWFKPALGGMLVIHGNGVFYVKTSEDYPALYARANLAEIDATVTGINVTATLASE